MKPHNQIFILAQNLYKPLLRLRGLNSLAPTSKASFQELFVFPRLFLEALLKTSKQVLAHHPDIDYLAATDPELSYLDIPLKLHPILKTRSSRIAFLSKKTEQLAQHFLCGRLLIIGPDRRIQER